MNNNEEKILLLEKEISDLKRLFEDHSHTGIDGKKIPYKNLQSVPSLVVNDSDIVFSDVTTGNVSTTKHGFTPKAPNDTSKFLRGDGTWNAINIITVPAEALRQSLDTIVIDTNGVYVKKKEVQMKTSGGIRIKFEMRTSNASYTAYARIYKNGLPYGAEWSTTSIDYVLFSENLTGININDYIQLYIHCSFGAGMNVQNFRIYFDVVEAPTIILN